MEELKFSVPDRYKKKILCVARISKPKRFDIFCDTALVLPEYAFIWIGNKKNIADTPANVFCLGNIPEAGQYNKYMDLFILPSDYEGLPIVILEAMSVGKPIVASDVGGISEIVVDGENGYTVENTAIAFAGKIKYILENDDVHKKFSENSLRKYNEQLTVDKMAEKYLEIYRA
jgi:glycosyltransferase involved in cell wall biosynthesis